MKLSFDLKVLLEMAYEQTTKVKKGGRPGAERRKWAELEKLGFTPYLLAIPEYNKRMLRGRVPKVKEIVGSFSYPCNRRIAGRHGHFIMEDYRKWMKKADTKDLGQALTRLAQLNQAKVYLFWKRARM